MYIHIHVHVHFTYLQVKLRRNCSKKPLKSNDGARFEVAVELGEIPVVVTEMQYCAMVRGVDGMGRRWRGRRWRKWRPSVCVEEK